MPADRADRAGGPRPDTAPGGELDPELYKIIDIKDCGAGFPGGPALFIQFDNCEGFPTEADGFRIIVLDSDTSHLCGCCNCECCDCRDSWERYTFRPPGSTAPSRSAVAR